MIILDTNIVSEPRQPRPSEAVVTWLAHQHVHNLFTTTVTEAEILYGVALLDSGKRRDGLADAARKIFEVDFLGRVLSFDSAAAREFGVIAGLRKKAGLAIKVFDTQIAAIARAHRAAVATRDTADFQHCGIEIINPWAG